MSPDQKKVWWAEQWLTKADHDLQTARILLSTSGAPLDNACFHAQQAAEKSLKAFLVFHSVDFRKTHDLDALLDACVTVDAEFEQLRDDCGTLNPYAVDTRYPGPAEDYSLEEATAAVEAAERVRTLTGAKVRTP